jgi:NADH-quinone oxidoreductase subunit M
VFWELTLLPMVLLIGVWGGRRRVYASVKFLLFTLLGSALMLVAIVALVHAANSATFRLVDVLAQPPLERPIQLWLFAAFALAFAVKVPIVPLHTWLPDAHVEAPTGASVLLAGVLLKLGTYGFVRLGLPLFPEAAHLAAPLFVGLGIAGIWYGAWLAFAQSDVKKLVAYSSVSHMGLVVAAVFAANSIGLAGGVLQMVTHGVTTGALFLLVGVLYDRAHTRELADFGGVWRKMPIFSAVLMLMALASIGLPGLGGFVAEWLSLAGAFRANPWYGALAAFGMVLGAAYMLWMLQRLLFGAVGEAAEKLHDISGRELAALLPLVVLIVWLGVHPRTFLAPIDAAATQWSTLVARAGWVASGR